MDALGGSPLKSPDRGTAFHPKVQRFAVAPVVCFPIEDAPEKAYFVLCKARRLCYTLRRANPWFRLFLGSSAVEHSTVNRMVAGSNPARGATLFLPLLSDHRSFRPPTPKRSLSRASVGSGATPFTAVDFAEAAFARRRRECRWLTARTRPDRHRVEVCAFRRASQVSQVIARTLGDLAGAEAIDVALCSLFSARRRLMTARAEPAHPRTPTVGKCAKDPSPYVTFLTLDRSQHGLHRLHD